MIALVFEVWGAVSLSSLIAFLVLAAVAAFRPDLDEEEFDLIELEKLTQLANIEQSADALSLEPAIMEESSWSTPPVKRSKRVIQRRPRLVQMRKLRTA
jgi:hypothetical protein